jgi:3-deoxy-D-manno-octulosonic-acid transferase
MVWTFFNIVRYTLGSMVLVTAVFLNKKVRDRRLFERNWGPRHLPQEDYSIWFHVSSEGELEQVMPILNGLVEKQLLLDDKSLNEKMLLLFTSPSLEKKMAEIQKEKNNVDCMAFPLLNLWPWGKNSIFNLKRPKTFFMVRYDFFPELLSIGHRINNFILLSASLKNKDISFQRNKFKKIYYKLIISSFNKVFASGPMDNDRILKLFDGSMPGELYAHDFRHGQIIKRQKAQTHLEKTHCLKTFIEQARPYSLNDRMIFGSLWSSELSLFNDEFLEDLIQKKTFVLIAPHKLSGDEWDSIEEVVSSWSERGIDVAYWNQFGLRGEGNVILCQVPGLLCELYPYFVHSFVGGGHGRSVHSLLEPFWGGGHIYCGPKVQRSTEFDYVDEHSPRHLHIVRELPALYSYYLKGKNIALDKGAREKSAEIVMTNQSQYIELFSHKEMGL